MEQVFKGKRRFGREGRVAGMLPLEQRENGGGEWEKEDGRRRRWKEESGEEEKMRRS